jgi:hypothetical protein
MRKSAHFRQSRRPSMTGAQSHAKDKTRDPRGFCLRGASTTAARIPKDGANALGRRIFGEGHCNFRRTPVSCRVAAAKPGQVACPIGPRWRDSPGAFMASSGTKPDLSILVIGRS